MDGNSTLYKSYNSNSITLLRAPPHFIISQLNCPLGGPRRNDNACQLSIHILCTVQYTFYLYVVLVLLNIIILARHVVPTRESHEGRQKCPYPEVIVFQKPRGKVIKDEIGLVKLSNLHILNGMLENTWENTVRIQFSNTFCIYIYITSTISFVFVVCTLNLNDYYDDVNDYYLLLFYMKITCLSK